MEGLKIVPAGWCGHCFEGLYFCTEEYGKVSYEVVYICDCADAEKYKNNPHHKHFNPRLHRLSVKHRAKKGQNFDMFKRLVGNEGAT